MEIKDYKDSKVQVLDQLLKAKSNLLYTDQIYTLINKNI